MPKPLNPTPALWDSARTLLEQASPTLHRYPEEEYEHVRQAVATHTHWPLSHITLGRTTAEWLLFVLECVTGPDTTVWIATDHPYKDTLLAQLAQRHATVVDTPPSDAPLTLALCYQTCTCSSNALWQVIVNPTQPLDASNPALLGVWEVPEISLNPIPPVFAVCVDPALAQTLRAVTEPFHIPTMMLTQWLATCGTEGYCAPASAQASNPIPTITSNPASLQAILPSIRGIVPYVPGKGIKTMSKLLGLPVSAFSKLASNEHPTGVREGVIPQAIALLSQWQTSKASYEVIQDQLKHSIISHLQATTAPQAFKGATFSITPSQVHLGTGSVDLIKATIQGLMPLPSGSQAPVGVLSPKMPFAMYPFEVTKRAGQYQMLDLAPQYATPVDELIKAIQGQGGQAKPAVVFVANPRNPLGTALTSVDALIEALDNEQVMILDEAYIDFIRYDMGEDVYPDGVGLLHRYPHKRLMLLRTFSKSYAIAACRLGYAVTSTSLSHAVNQALLPCTVDPVSMAVGIASLEAPNKQQWAKDAATLVAQEKERFYALFDELGLTYVKSFANFVYFEVATSPEDTRFTGQSLFDALVKQGVIIRPVLADSARVSVGNPTENSAFITAMRQAYAN
jgi:histidinol-phosphate aminotransferase